MTRGDSLTELPPPPPETVRTWLAYWRYLALWETAARLPDRLARRLPERVGHAWFELASTERRRQVQRNLRRLAPDVAPGEMRELMRAAFVSYARYWLDSFRFHVMDHRAVVTETPTEGLHHVDELRDQGRGGVFATAHLGSWEVGAFFTSAHDWGMVVVAELVEPRRLFERFVQLRRAVGIDVIPLVRGGDMLDQLERRVVERGQMATLLADRDLTRKGPIVEFFGEPCRLPPGTAALARRTGRPVAIGAFLTEGEGYRGVVLEPVDVSDLSVYDGTQMLAHGLERLIGRFPEQWHVFVPNWLADREPDHPVVAVWRRGDDWRPLARAESEARRAEGGG